MSRKHHVVPKGYLKAWAVSHQVMVARPGMDGAFRCNVAKAGVVTDFYRRFRPDGTPSDDVEGSLAGAESIALPLLRQLRDRWPLSDADKGILAQLLALQLSRGSTWRDFHDHLVERSVPEMRREFLESLEASSWRLPDGSRTNREEFEAAFAKGRRDISSDTQRLERMLESVEKVSMVLGSMHWSLLEFEDDRLMTSDHPVVVWPLSRELGAPVDWRPSQGLLPTLEVRFPVSPRSALLLTWMDAFDDDAPVLRAPPSAARNINACTRAQAAQQWFFKPSAEPGIARGNLPPVSLMLIRGYTAHRAASSRRRAAISERIQPLIGEPASGETALVTARRVRAAPVRT